MSWSGRTAKFGEGETRRPPVTCCIFFVYGYIVFIRRSSRQRPLIATAAIVTGTTITVTTGQDALAAMILHPKQALI